MANRHADPDRQPAPAGRLPAVIEHSTSPDTSARGTTARSRIRSVVMVSRLPLLAVGLWHMASLAAADDADVRRHCDGRLRRAGGYSTQSARNKQLSESPRLPVGPSRVETSVAAANPRDARPRRLPRTGRYAAAPGRTARRAAAENKLAENTPATAGSSQTTKNFQPPTFRQPDAFAVEGLPNPKVIPAKLQSAGPVGELVEKPLDGHPRSSAAQHHASAQGRPGRRQQSGLSLVEGGSGASRPGDPRARHPQTALATLGRPSMTDQAKPGETSATTGQQLARAASPNPSASSAQTRCYNRSWPVRSVESVFNDTGWRCASIWQKAAPTGRPTIRRWHRRPGRGSRQHVVGSERRTAVRRTACRALDTGRRRTLAATGHDDQRPTRRAAA